jgi:hypothetical protein
VKESAFFASETFDRKARESNFELRSDHNPVIAKVKLKLRKPGEAKPSKKLDLELLKTMPKVKEDFVYEVNNRFQVLQRFQVFARKIAKV